MRAPVRWMNPYMLLNMDQSPWSQQFEHLATNVWVWRDRPDLDQGKLVQSLTMRLRRGPAAQPPTTGSIAAGTEQGTYPVQVLGERPLPETLIKRVGRLSVPEAGDLLLLLIFGEGLASALDARPWMEEQPGQTYTFELMQLNRLHKMFNDPGPVSIAVTPDGREVMRGLLRGDDDLYQVIEALRRRFGEESSAVPAVFSEEDLGAMLTTAPRFHGLLDKDASDFVRIPDRVFRVKNLSAGTEEKTTVPAQGARLNWYSSEIVGTDGIASPAWMELLDSAENRLVVPLAYIRAGTVVLVQKGLLSSEMIRALREMKGIELKEFLLQEFPQVDQSRENVFVVAVPHGSELEERINAAGGIVVNLYGSPPNQRPESARELGALINAARAADGRVLEVGGLYRSTDPELRNSVIAVDTQL